MENQTKILVIGAGPSGLSTLKALDQLQPKEKYKIVCYQKQEDLGGQWNFTMESGVDKYGEPVHSGMYSQLWTNAPKECFEYYDYTYHEHFGKPVPTYLPRDIFANYILKRF